MTKKYALFGSGNTGARIPELLRADETYTFFNRTNPPDRNNLADFDAIICFAPGPALEHYMELLAETRIPLISGATGIKWPANWHQRLCELEVTWVWSDNFALGMNIAKQLIELLSSLSSLYQRPQWKIHEVHHTGKLDAPSGTALAWQRWLEQDAQISSDRIGNVIGKHQLTLKTEYEQISVTHEALDRRIFAHGALWACRQLLDGSLPHGLLPLEFLTSQQRQGEFYVNH